jgi:hypothetical protein
VTQGVTPSLHRPMMTSALMPRTVDPDNVTI